MKDNPKETEFVLSVHTLRNPNSSSRVLPKLMFYFILALSLTYIFYTIKLMFPANTCVEHRLTGSSDQIPIVGQKNNLSSTHHTELTKNPYELTQNESNLIQNPETLNLKTQLHHIVFGIAASAKLWEHRKNYIKLWWRPNETRGFIWLDKVVNHESKDDNSLPPLKISSDTSKFRYRNKEGDRSAIRISRIVSETLRLGLEDVRWFVMGDDDTFFIADNLVRVLEKYDHTQFYYIGSSSESHLQNIHFSYNMAYGGGGFAISYALAKALEKMQDKCIERYPHLYGSDDRIQACMAELGVPLTKEIGFHQFDVYGNVFGLLAAHPVAPLVSLHHLDVIQPIFPNTDQLQALERLKVPIKLDSAGLMQQSICYDKSRQWTISVSWGYAVQIFRGIIPVSEVETPSTTFLDWYRKGVDTAHTFNSRPISRNACQRPIVYVLSNAIYNPSTNQTASEYVQNEAQHSKCKRKMMTDPFRIHRVEVYKKPDPRVWDKPPRRNCCRVMPSEKKGTIVIDVDACGEGEIIESW